MRYCEFQLNVAIVIQHSHVYGGGGGRGERGEAMLDTTIQFAFLFFVHVLVPHRKSSAVGSNQRF